MIHETNEEEIKALIHQMRIIAGQLGLAICGENETVIEAVHYERCVSNGMTCGLLEILGLSDFREFGYWLGDCLCNYSINDEEWRRWPLLHAISIADPANGVDHGEPQEVRERALAQLWQWVETNPLPAAPSKGS